MSQWLYTNDTACCCLSTRRIPSIIDAWLRASEKIAILSSGAGLLPAGAKREPILPTAVINAVFAENPVGQTRQSCRTNQWKLSFHALNWRTEETAFIWSLCPVHTYIHTYTTVIKENIWYLLFLQFCHWFLHQFVVSSIPRDDGRASGPHPILLSCLPMPNCQNAGATKLGACSFSECMPKTEERAKKTCLGCSATDCRMRAEAHVVVRRERNQFPLQLVFFDIHLAI